MAGPSASASAKLSERRACHRSREMRGGGGAKRVCGQRVVPHRTAARPGDTAHIDASSVSTRSNFSTSASTVWPVKGMCARRRKLVGSGARGKPGDESRLDQIEYGSDARCLAQLAEGRRGVCLDGPPGRIVDEPYGW